MNRRHFETKAMNFLRLLPLLLFWIWRLQGWSAGSGRRFAPSALALLLPIALVIAPVAWHNAAYDRLLEGKASRLETVRRLATGRFVSIAESSAVNLRLGNEPVLRELNRVTHPDHFKVWDRLMGEPYRSGGGNDGLFGLQRLGIRAERRRPFERRRAARHLVPQDAVVVGEGFRAARCHQRDPSRSGRGSKT